LGFVKLSHHFLLLLIKHHPYLENCNNNYNNDKKKVLFFVCWGVETKLILPSYQHHVLAQLNNVLAPFIPESHKE